MFVASHLCGLVGRGEGGLPIDLVLSCAFCFVGGVAGDPVVALAKDAPTRRVMICGGVAGPLCNRGKDDGHEDQNS